MLNASEIYTRLYAAYGRPQWWSDNPYQVLVQAILVQNTAWTSVTKVTEAIGDRLTPRAVTAMSAEELEELIRPCGFCKAKAAAIRRVTAWYETYACDAAAVRAVEQARLRRELLAVKGVGAETADVILVYAFHKPSFVIDAYTRRFLARLGFSFDDDEAVRAFFEQDLERNEQLYGRYHWLILTHGITRCKKTPVCEQCPFGDVCQRSV